MHSPIERLFTCFFDDFVKLLLWSSSTLVQVYCLFFFISFPFPSFFCSLPLFVANILWTNSLRLVFIFHFITGADGATDAAAASYVCWANVFSILSAWKIRLRTRAKYEKKKTRMKRASTNPIFCKTVFLAVAEILLFLLMVFFSYVRVWCCWCCWDDVKCIYLYAPL